MKQFGWWCAGCITFYFDFVPGGICPCCDGYMAIRIWSAVYNERMALLSE